jgi:hypothetical protein
VKRRFLCGALSLAILVMCALGLRQRLLDAGFPNGSMLEALAQQLRSGEVTAGEAVAAFCRNLVSDDPV